MPQTGLIFRALIASPSDCAQERKIIPEVVAAWNAVHSVDTAAVIEPVLWETHSRPAFGDRPQGIINQQLVDRCDLLIGAFWTRLGTPTGVAESGTAEEIEQFRAAQKPVLLYFSSAPVVPDSLDLDQYRALVEYRKRLAEEGLYSEYESLADFREQLQRHLAGTMIDLLRVQPSRALEAPPEPDPLEEQRAAVGAFQAQFETFLRRLNAEWVAERDSEPINTNEGKYILSRAADEVVHFRSMITHDRSGLSGTLDEALKRLRSIQRHQVYLDGGQSFREFWEEGDRILDLLGTVPSQLMQVLEEAHRSAPPRA
ncbi:MAG TPA: hypothetical protein VGR37_14085 [Longimicrobiaceae bacterium]|nr:hypothetical protein [Longimicrobiaceae bacterium]